jgi:hypothetical protein
MSQEVKVRRISILPKSSLGRWSVGLAAAFILLLILFAVLTGMGGEPGPFVLIFIVNVVIGISFLAAFIAGLISIIKSKERSILVLLAVALGFCALLFYLGEFLCTH